MILYQSKYYFLTIIDQPHQERRISSTLMRSQAITREAQEG